MQALYLKVITATCCPRLATQAVIHRGCLNLTPLGHGPTPSSPAGSASAPCQHPPDQHEPRSQIGRLFAGLGKEVQAALAETNSGGKVTGLLLDEVTDPFSFEVHPPVQPEDAALELPLLPPYISREHDEMLNRVVRAATDGQSGIAVLVGGSSTGKTRACWASASSSRPLTGPNPPGSSPSPRPPADPRTDTANAVTGWPGQLTLPRPALRSTRSCTHDPRKSGYGIQQTGLVT